MITKEEFLKNTTEEELFSVIESFLNRFKEKTKGKVVWEHQPSDREKGEIIKEILEEYKK